MIKYILIFILPIYLYGNLTYDTDHEKSLKVLKSLDIDPSFINDPVMKEIKEDILDKNLHFFRAMEGGYIFIPAIKTTLLSYNIPQEFLYLAMAESNFTTKAYSTKRAAGLWQFMPKTAKYYNLKIDEYIDERRDPIKSTVAAAKYLSRLYDRFGKWYLAAIAYNCGGGRVSKAIRKAKTDNLAVLLDPKKEYLPAESRHYIRKIVALALIGSNENYFLKNEYGYLINRANAYSLAAVTVTRGESLQRISKLLGIPQKDLKKLNRHLKYDFVPPYANKFSLYIPKIKLSEFQEKYKPESIKNIYKLYTVRSGDNLSKIGKKFGVSYRVIKDFNHLRNSRIKPKQKLVIPIPKRSLKKRIDSRHYYIVKKGDSLESISKRHKISIKNIRSQNDIRGSLIRVGDRLRLYE